MSKLNPSPVSSSKKGVSYNGNVQQLKNEAQQLYELAVMSMFGKDTYYESNNQQIQRAKSLIDVLVRSNKLDFIANLIVYARTDMNIRTMPIVLTVLFADALRQSNKVYPEMRSLVRDVVQRVDQITDMYAYALTVFGSKKSIPTAIKRGLGDCFNKFNEYQFAKYNRSGSVKLSDVLRITHPKAISPEQGAVMERIIKDTLETPYTWEVELSVNGQKTGSEKKSNEVLWTELVNSSKLGYMALLRNMRNILGAKVSSDVVKTVLTRIADEKQVRKSKQLPYRFLSAKSELQKSGLLTVDVQRALRKALDHSFANVPQLGENIWIIIDCSGSMQGGWGSQSNGGSPIQLACLFAAALVKSSADSKHVAVTMFSDNAANIPVNPDDTITTICDSLESKVYGGGTNLQAALNLKDKLGFEPDVVVVLSDMQVNQLSARNSTQIFSPDCVKLAMNLAAYDSTPLGDNQGWLQLGGYSDRVFDLIPALKEKNSISAKFSHKYTSPSSKRDGVVEE